MHGRHFTFKSILSHTAVTIVAPSVTGTFVSKDRPYVVQGPWLQVLLSEELSEKMAEEFEILKTPDKVMTCRIALKFRNLGTSISRYFSILILPSMSTSTFHSAYIYRCVLLQIQLPKTFSWPEHNLVITIIND